jgi:hypothetical protein
VTSHQSAPARKAAFGDQNDYESEFLTTINPRKRANRVYTNPATVLIDDVLISLYKKRHT